MNETVVVVTGAAPLDPVAVADLPTDAVVIAADGGLDHALAAGLEPTTLVGDLDSVSDDGLAWAERHATIERHDPAKDFTDTELALAHAVSLAPDRLIMVAGAGDRLDHTFTAIGALGAPALTSVPVIECWWGDQLLHVLHGPGRVRLAVVPDATVSLVATHGRCTGVSISGTEWPLDDSDLAPLAGHGVSNVAVGDEVDITVSSGVLTIFSQPFANTKELP
jgi:thiamine pyrophosphokinase